ncbi:MAG: hypothetical protein QXL16_02340 [Candidatus Micrarchaeaceae archaeon]
MARLELALLILLALSMRLANAEHCNATISSPGLNYTFSGCTVSYLYFYPNASNSHIFCHNSTFINANIFLEGNDRNEWIYDCSFQNSSVTALGHSSLFIISPKNTSFKEYNLSSNSNITIAYKLTLDIFHPFGYNTSSTFGDLVAGYAYILPLMNNTFPLHNDELLMYEFSNSSFPYLFERLKSSIPFGAYGINETKIYRNTSYEPYGKIVGSKTFLLPYETISKEKTVYYNPYEIDYSFLGFDQLVMFTINITKDTTLTPFYIEPIFPRFNFFFIPDNGSSQIRIRYVIAIPPQDMNWSFEGFLYKYNPIFFTTNPREGIGPESSFVKVIEFPNSTPSEIYNGTYLYFINYTAQVGVGINSSIITINGVIPGEGKFIEDSTTPSFSFGVSYCSTDNMTKNPLQGVAITAPGTYHMVKTLYPLHGDAIPLLVDAPCVTGILVKGNNINIFCDNGTINDTYYGIVVLNSSNVKFYNCNVKGNGILLNHSSGVSFFNTSLQPGLNNSFGIKIINSYFTFFNNLSIGNGYKSIISSFSSSGTPESLGTNIFGLSICNSTEYAQVKQFAFAPNVTFTCAPIVIRKLYEIKQQYLLYVLTALVALFYIVLTIKVRRSEKGRKAKRRGMRGRHH